MHGIGREVSRFLERYDVLLTPTMATPPLPLGRLALTRSDFPGLVRISRARSASRSCSSLGTPGDVGSALLERRGLPIGVQFAGRFGDEATLFRLAAQLEARAAVVPAAPGDPA